MGEKKTSSSHKTTKKSSKPASRASAPLKKASSQSEHKGHTKAESKGKNLSKPASSKKTKALSSSKGGNSKISSPSGRRLSSGFMSKSLLEYNSAGETVCREVACEGLSTSGGYCRLHYIKNWKKIKRKEAILREGKLNQYIEELVTKYPDKYIEAIRQDLESDKEFSKVIYDLDLDEGIDDFDVDGGDNADNLIDSIKRDFEDEGDPY